jgi:hypothetical protein
VNEPVWLRGQRVIVLPLMMEATVVRQLRHYDCGEEFWGNVIVRYDDGIYGESNSWQLRATSSAPAQGK